MTNFLLTENIVARFAAKKLPGTVPGIKLFCKFIYFYVCLPEGLPSSLASSTEEEILQKFFLFSFNLGHFAFLDTIPNPDPPPWYLSTVLAERRDFTRLGPFLTRSLMRMSFWCSLGPVWYQPTIRSLAFTLENNNLSFYNYLEFSNSAP